MQRQVLTVSDIYTDRTFLALMSITQISFEERNLLVTTRKPVTTELFVDGSLCIFVTLQVPLPVFIFFNYLPITLKGLTGIIRLFDRVVSRVHEAFILMNLSG